MIKVWKRMIVTILFLTFFLSLTTTDVFARAWGTNIYKGKPSRAVVDGVTYSYRDSVDDGGIQITAIQVPNNRTSLVIPDTINGNTVTALHLRTADGAKKLAKLNSLTLPKHMTYEGMDFNPTCVPINVDIQGNYLVPSLNEYFTGLSEIKLEEGNPYMLVKDGVLYNKDITSLLYYPYNKKDTEYTEPSTLTDAHWGANYNKRKYLKKLTYSTNKNYTYTTSCSYTNIETVIIPKNIQNISEECFSHCSKLKNVKWTNGVKVIYDKAFLSCTSLKKITFPKSLQLIQTSAFRNCTNLRSIVLPKNLMALYNYAFYGTKCKKITIPKSVGNMGKKVFGKGTKIKKQSYLKKSSNHYQNDFCTYIAMATIIDKKSGKKTEYEVDDIDEIYAVKKKIKLKKGKKHKLKTEACISLPMEEEDWGYIDSNILKFTSSNPKVATVTKNGTIKAKKKGTAIIRVELLTASYTPSSCQVTVKVQ